MEIQESDEQQPDEKGVAIYSKWAILGFSIFFSPIGGAVLLMLNLRSIGYKKAGISVLLFAIAYQFIAGILLASLLRNAGAPINKQDIIGNNKMFIYSLIINIIGGGILAEYFFKKYFPEDDYEHKSIMIPILIALLISVPISLLFSI
jgi:hypothetical protein